MTPIRYPKPPIELPYEDFIGGVNRLEEAGIDMERTPEEAWPHFRAGESTTSRSHISSPTGCQLHQRRGPGHVPGGRAPILPSRPIDRQPGHHGGH